jgi:hypothetical protein
MAERSDRFGRELHAQHLGDRHLATPVTTSKKET